MGVEDSFGDAGCAAGVDEEGVDEEGVIGGGEWGGILFVAGQSFVAVDLLEGDFDSFFFCEGL